MREVAEISKVFKHNFKRNIEIFKHWILGKTLESISQQYAISVSQVKQVLRRAERSLMYSNAMTWDEMPGKGQLNYKQYQDPASRTFYLELVDNSLSLELKEVKGDL